MDGKRQQELASLHQYRRFKIDLSAFYQNKKVRTYTSLVLTIGTVVFFLFSAIRPTVKTIARLSREIKDNKKVAQGLDRKIESLNSAQIEYQRIKAEIPLIDEALPLHPDLAKLTRQLEALSRKDGVEISTLQFSPSILIEAGGESKEEGDNKKIAVGKGQETGLEFGLTAKGSYDNLRLFQRDLTALRRIIKIESFGFSQQKDQSMTLSLRARGVYLK